jgi:hypothetical protein
MKPFFSICVSVNLPDSNDQDAARDEHGIKLTVARNTDQGDDKDDATFCDMSNVTNKLIEAIDWLSSKLPTRDQDDFRSHLVGQLLCGLDEREELEQFLETEMEVGDADFGDMIRRIAKKCEEANI